MLQRRRELDNLKSHCDRGPQSRHVEEEVVKPRTSKIDYEVMERGLVVRGELKGFEEIDYQTLIERASRRRPVVSQMFEVVETPKNMIIKVNFLKVFSARRQETRPRTESLADQTEIYRLVHELIKPDARL